MKVHFEQKSYSHVEFMFSPEVGDGVVPIDRVHFMSPKLGRMKPDRIALISYLLCSGFIGNTLDVEGIYFSPYLATALVDNFHPRELFLQPVNSVPKRIMPVLDVRKQQWDWVDDGGMTAGNDIAFSRTQTGYKIVGVDQSESVMRSNLRMATTFLDNCEIVERLVVAAIAFDVTGAQSIARVPPTISKTSLYSLLTFAGFSHA
ncbi:hypothetical protein [Neoaquamicrobium sediminum]|uniref:hypothetical protein n=1 Tax=Neoaquamicrobium sediminum TaxID=1849104 RepID=UPI003BA863F1